MKKLRSYFADAFFYLLGCALFAAAVTALLAANEISPGGLTGIATLLQYLSGFPSGTALLLLNLPILYLGFRKFGGRFILHTGIVTVLLSAMMTLAEQLLPRLIIDPILAAVFGGIAMGAGLGLVMLRGATTGGIDIIAKLLHRRFPHLSIGRLILIPDAVVVLLAALVYRNLESALYSVLAMYASTRVTDLLLYGADRGRLIFMITGAPDAICKQIGETLRRGVTVLPATGGYTGEPRPLLLCAVRRHEVAAVSRIVYSLDPAAFLIVTEVGEVLGEGFRPFSQ